MLTVLRGLSRISCTLLLLPAMRGYRTTGALIVIIVAYCASCVEAAGRSPACPVWSTGDCKCGDSIGGIVRCDEETGRVSVHFGSENLCHGCTKIGVIRE